MPQYCYSPLSPAGDSIRLLRLKPAKDKSADIHCELIEYALHDSSAIHLYEALSYVWGNSEKKLRVFMHSYSFDVTDNLHAALLELRNHTMERTIWVDAMCIDQKNQEEKELQIQIMARIYGQASIVIVWLGEAADFSDYVLEQILAAGVGRETSQHSSNRNVIQRQMMSLLQRPWFRRIWVLQEVAAARSILITCGSAMIDGHAFCLGVEPMMRSYDAPPDLQSLIHSVAYLIRGAIFRPRGPNWVPNEVCPLSDLIDMYHTHEATLHSDEVYALLGMSSDGLLQPGLSPDYDVPWKVLFETLIKHALCKEITVDVLPDGESAKIEGRGYILGWISSIQAGTTPSGRQGVTITWREFQDTTIRRTDWICHWEIQPSAKQIMGGDIICLFQGASRPTIMRFCDGCWAIIVIAITPPQLIRPRSGKSQWLECLEEINRLFPRNFRCVWDWDKLPGKMPSQEENKTPRECLEQIKETLNLTLVLEDLERYREGEEQFQEAMIYYEMASKKRCTNEFSASLPSFMSRVDLDLMNEKHYRPPLLWAAERGYVSVVLLFIARFDVDIGFKDYNGRTAIELAAANGHLTVVERLLEYNADVISTAARKSRIALRAAAVGRNLTLYKELLPAKEYVNAAVAAAADNKRAALLTAADGGYLPVVQRLLQEDIDVNAPAVRNGRTALQAAAGGGHLLVVEHLLQENADVNAPAAVHNGKPALYTAAGGGHLPVAMRRLKRNRGANAAAAFNGRTALQAAAGGGHLAVVERLLQENADVNAAQWNGRTALQAAVEGGHLAVVELLRRHEDLQSSVEH